MSKTRTFRIWHGMRQRCENSRATGFKNYGGRGITVCERWNDFANFLADMGEAPDGKSLERAKNDGPYSPGNCVWASGETQHNNKRTVQKVTHNGESLSLAQWARKLGVGVDRLRRRQKAGWPIERVLTG